MTVPSYPAPGYPAPAPRSRPLIVTVASYLLYAVAAIEVINAIVAFATMSRMADTVRDVYAGTEAEDAAGIVNAAFVFGAVINLLIGAGFAVLAYFNGRGKNPSRIVTWVIGGIAICCFGFGLSGNALVSAMESAGTTDTTTWQDDDLDQRINDALPGWYTPTTTALAAIALLAILATVILLALPASNEFFRKPAPSGWDPSAGYPPYPGQQPPPGGGQYPMYGQQNPYPPQYPGQGYPAPQGQPGQPAPGLPPYPGQGTPPPASGPYSPPTAGDQYAPPPASDPYAQPPASSWGASPPGWGENRQPADPSSTPPSSPPASSPSTPPASSPSEPDGTEPPADGTQPPKP
ncbi:hypothetical protein AB0J83_18840 [Actinoplanes sp. NPDC049596]|uniref:hypothetical protein n=1 Tax=unclassified Actinoplanes TaxID=2626549 RepID=UPI0034133EF9